MVIVMEQAYYERSAENVYDQSDIQVQILDSISFGKYSIESLAWDNWSPFSRNRRLEEVQRCSVPGSVAKKIAYFEAYYKRIGAQKVIEEQEDSYRFACESQTDALLLTTVTETGLAEHRKQHLEEIGRRDEISEEIEEMQVASQGSGNNMPVDSKSLLPKGATKAGFSEQKEHDISKIETRDEVFYGGSVSIIKYIHSCWTIVKQLIRSFKQFRLLNFVVET